MQMQIMKRKKTKKCIDQQFLDCVFEKIRANKYRQTLNHRKIFSAPRNINQDKKKIKLDSKTTERQRNQTAPYLINTEFSIRIG